MHYDYLYYGTPVFPELLQCCIITQTPHHHNRFTTLFPRPSGWAGAGRELLNFVVQGEINRGRYTDHPAGHHSIRTNQCPPPQSHIFYGPDALPAAQPTVSKHWRLLHKQQNILNVNMLWKNHSFVISFHNYVTSLLSATHVILANKCFVRLGYKLNKYFIYCIA